MNRKLCTWLIVAIAGGALGAGCGSSSSTSSSQTSSTPAASTPATTAATPPAATPTASTPATTSAGSGAASALAVQQIVAECQAVIHRSPTLSASVKAKVEGICNKAASGDLAGARAAAKEVCVEVINASPVPAAAKQQALGACNTQ